jgi:hypothetical protein
MLKRIDLPALPESENQRVAALSRNGRIGIDGARLAPTVVTLDSKVATWRAAATISRHTSARRRRRTAARRSWASSAAPRCSTSSIPSTPVSRTIRIPSRTSRR